MIRFRRALEVLSDAEVDFVVIGGVCAIIHGSAHITLDLDICYSRDGSNLRRLASALAPFHPRPRGLPAELPFIWDASTLCNGALFTLETDIGEIDLLSEVAGLGSFDEVKRLSITAEAFGRRIATLNLSALIQAKRAAGRVKDLTVLPELESLLDADDASNVR